MQFLEHRELLAADVPTVSDLSKTLHFNVASPSYTFKLSDFTAGYQDAAGTALSQIVITTLPAHGDLSVSGTSITANTTVTAANIANLVYFYNPSSTYTGTDSFTWSATNGTSQAATSANFTLTIPDQAPTIANISKTIEATTSPRFNTGDFTSVFKDADKGDTLYQVQIKTLPQHGKLFILGGDATQSVVNAGNYATVAAGDSISLGQLANLIYEPNAGYTGKDYFTWNANDLEQFAATDANVLINVTAVPNLVVLGGGLRIANHSDTISATNFTDFGGMTTTPDSTLGTDTRTFTIQNNGNTTINLTGGAKNLVRISGTDASDFSVVTQPDLTSLTPGESTTFTIKFAPAHNDTRLAMLTIPNSTGTPYTFAIGGTGLITTSTLAGTVYEQQGSTVLGAGPGAVAGETLTVTYSGFILNYSASNSTPTGLSGTVFDSTTNEGGIPFSFALGQSQVITGWDSGLVGMKEGETRVLLIPATAAYGTTGQGAIPANASLEFTITLLHISKPTTQVSGNGVKIVSGDKSPSKADGTDFGTLAANTVSSAAKTFTITNAGKGALTGVTVSVSGPAAADFVVTQPQGSASTETFTVQFKPTIAGQRTAVIHVNNAIATNPDYTFTVTGNSSSYIDITPSIGTAAELPAVVILHNTPSFTVPLTIQNIGTGSLPANATTDVHFYLKNTATSAQIDFPQTDPALNVGGMEAQQTKTFNIALKLPASLAAGKYVLVAVINGKHGVTETLSTNDTATGTQTFSVEPVTTNLAGDLVSTTLPTTIVSNQAISGNVVVNLRNAGNQKMPAGQQITLKIVAHNTSTGTDTTLTVSPTLSVSNMAGHTAQQFTVAVSHTAGLIAGSYQYEAIITPVQHLTESNTADNTIATTSAGVKESLTVTDPDISGTLGNSTLPTSIVAGSTASHNGTLAVVVKNSGNIALPAAQEVTISLLAHPTAGGSDITLVAAGTQYAVGALAAGSTKTFTISADFTGKDFSAGNYTIEAQITPVPSLTETSTANNLVTLNASNATIGLTATA